MANYNINALRQQALTKTILKQQVHDAFFVLMKIANSFETSFENHTPSYSDYTFAQVFSQMDSGEGLENPPYHLKNYNKFMAQAKCLINDPKTGLNKDIIAAFDLTLNRQADGKKDLIAYCKDHTSAISEQNTYCSDDFINKAKEFVDLVGKIDPYTDPSCQ